MRSRPHFNQKLFLSGFAAVSVLSLAACVQAGPPAGRGMPEDAREQIHTLFDNHTKFQRKVTKTEDGYVAVTESDDKKLVKALQTHVEQMSKRLESGLMVRRWDPAFEEYVNHYDEMEHQFEKTDKGVRMTVKGRTEEAAKIARNHASVISAFLAHGWEEHDKTHATVAK